MNGLSFDFLFQFLNVTNCVASPSLGHVQPHCDSHDSSISCLKLNTFVRLKLIFLCATYKIPDLLCKNQK